MPLGTAHTRAVQVTYFDLVQPVDLMECMVTLLSIDYSGAIICRKNELGVVEYGIQTSGPNQGTVTAALGDVLVWNGTSLESMRTEVFQSRYDIP